MPSKYVELSTVPSNQNNNNNNVADNADKSAKKDSVASQIKLFWQKQTPLEKAANRLNHLTGFTWEVTTALDSEEKVLSAKIPHTALLPIGVNYSEFSLKEYIYEKTGFHVNMKIEGAHYLGLGQGFNGYIAEISNPIYFESLQKSVFSIPENSPTQLNIACDNLKKITGFDWEICRGEELHHIHETAIDDNVYGCRDLAEQEFIKQLQQFEIFQKVNFEVTANKRGIERILPDGKIAIRVKITDMHSIAAIAALEEHVEANSTCCCTII